MLNNKNKIESYNDVDVKPGTDAIRIWHSSIHGAILIKQMSGKSMLYLTSTIPLDTGDYVIISDCKNG